MPAAKGQTSSTEAAILAAASVMHILHEISILAFFVPAYLIIEHTHTKVTNETDRKMKVFLFSLLRLLDTEMI